ncbi:hypothetical protein AHF37_03680 [Paragonimus kellicotti]|nr:hypothetical protein AHF37_03680 [Paragonimus kellicotti]
MRYTENVDTIDPLDEGVRKELLSGKFTVLPSAGTVDDDNQAATVAIFTANRHWPPLTTHRDTLKGVLYQLDIAMMDEQSQRKGLIVLYDMRDAKYANFDYHLCIKLLNLFKGIYPARLRKVIIVEAPMWFRAPFGVLRLFVKEKMRDRISTVDFDELHVHLTPSLIQRVFQQLTRHRHYDWLRTCLEKSDHADQLPPDYFVTPQPVYRSLGSGDVLQLTDNRRRNRYLDVPCLDATAVELSDGTYLHANWVHGYRSPRAYILAQGRLTIVEGQRVKCAPYWPSRSRLFSNTSSSCLRSSDTPHLLAMGNSSHDLWSTDSQEDSSSSAYYGEFQVTNIGETMEADGLYRRTRLNIRRRSSTYSADRRSTKRSDYSPNSTSSVELPEQSFIVDHLFYLGWPDFDVPSDSDGFLAFLSEVRQLHQARCDELRAALCARIESHTEHQVPQNFPLLIHCSAGIGRTGTFVTVDICLQQAINEGFLDVPDVISRLRDQRAGAVQVPKQYAFIHSALSSSLTRLNNGTLQTSSTISPSS